MPSNEFGQPVGDGVPGWTAPPMPPGVTLAGTAVRLEALSTSHVPGLFAATSGPDDGPRWTYMGAGPFEDETGMRGYVQSLVDQPALVPYAILDTQTGQPLGMCSYLRLEPAQGTGEIGYIMYGPDLARTRGATEAMYLLARHFFDLGYRRYEWKCDDLNAPSRAAAERLGFTYEGTWRQAMMYKGRNRDTAWFAMTDGDWQRLRPAYEEWLSAAEGRHQAQSLSELTRAALGR